MRLTYLKLENFAAVRAGMGLSVVELDFTKGKNVLNLLVGRNGSGKTALLSAFQPYAGLGHLESRDDADMIIPKKDGHKTAIFKTKNHEYYIEHHYQWQGENRSRKISSYIKKDGKELNAAGTVTSFNAIVESEFKIDANFLKLLRLGPNVKNFITLSATDRKSFISKLLAEVEIYLKDQKISSERSNLLSTALKVAIDKKKKLGIEDITILSDTITQKEKNLEQYRNLKEAEIKSFYEFQGSVNVSLFDTCDDTITSLKSKESDLRREIGSLHKSKFVHITIGDEPPIIHYNATLKSLNDEKTEIISERAILYNAIGSKEDEKKELENRASEAKSSMEESELVEYIDSVKKEISTFEKNHKNMTAPSVNKEQLTGDIDKINMILFHIDNILSLPSYALEYYRKKYNDIGSDMNKIHSYYLKHSEEIREELASMEASKSKVNGILYIPKTCESYKVCPYYNLLKSETSVDKSKKAELEEELECLEGLNTIAGSIFNIRKILSMRYTGITEYTITEENVMSAVIFEDKTRLVDYPKVQKLLEYIEEYEMYQHSLERLKEAETNLSLLRSKMNKESYTDLMDKISKISYEIMDIEEKVKTVNKKLEKVLGKIQKVEEQIEDYAAEIEYQNKFSGLSTELSNTSAELEKMYEVKRDKVEYQRQKEIFRNKIAQIETSIKTEESEIYDLRVKQTTFKELSDEIAKVEYLYEYSEYIKDAVSSKTGIPKIHVAFYCRALKSVANEIIKEIYDGELILRDFHITDTKFDIPYYTKGATISDIRYGSQAETSVATVALSFAILMQFMPKYNIVLLDEIDGPMHEANKERLFAALEGQLKSIGCEQVFLITQSKMFNNYPVNLIITDPDYSQSVNKNTDIIFQR